MGWIFVVVILIPSQATEIRVSQAVKELLNTTGAWNASIIQRFLRLDELKYFAPQQIKRSSSSNDSIKGARRYKPQHRLHVIERIDLRIMDYERYIEIIKNWKHGMQGSSREIEELELQLNRMIHDLQKMTSRVIQMRREMMIKKAEG